MHHSATGDLIRRLFADIAAEDGGFSRHERNESAGHARDGRLADSVRTDERHRFGITNFERQSIERAIRAVHRVYVAKTERTHAD